MSIATANPRARRAPSEIPAPAHAGNLRLVKPAPKRTAGEKNRAILVGPALVLACLLSVAVAQAILTEGQVRLTKLDAQVASAQTTRADLELQVAQEEQPSEVIAAARNEGMVEPSVISDLPTVGPGTGSTPEHNASARLAAKQTRNDPTTDSVPANGATGPR
jgi:cell division protein FtsL